MSRPARAEERSIIPLQPCLWSHEAIFQQQFRQNLPSPLSERVYLLMRHKSLEEDKLLRIEFVDFMKNVLTRMDCSRLQLYKVCKFPKL